VRSESEVRWIRSKNNVGQRVVTSQWHAIVPGWGSLDVPPGTACGIGLTGSLTTVAHSAIRSLDGRQHDECVEIAEGFLADVAGASPGPLRAADPPQKLAPPANTSAPRLPPTQKVLPGGR